MTGRPHDADIHAVVATLIALITDPDDKLHKGGGATERAGVLVDDLGLVCDLIADDLEVRADDELVEEFLRARKPRSFRSTDPDDSACRYVESVAGGPRDYRLLALAAVRSMARVVTADANGAGSQHWLWRLARDQAEDLWMSRTESSEVTAMVEAIDAALDVRFAVKRRSRSPR